MKTSRLFPTIIMVIFLNPLLHAQVNVQIPNLNFGDDECYAKYALPAEYEMVEKKVLTKAATDRDEILPAVYDTKTEKIMTAPAFTKNEIIPPVFEFVEEQVLVHPQTTKLVEVPAVYKTVTEKVLVKDASTKIVPVAAVFETIDESIMVKPEGRRFIVEPAIYDQIMEKVKIADEYQVKSPVPAIFENISKPYELEAAKSQLIHFKPTIKIINELVKIKEPTTKWVKKDASPNCLSADPKDCAVWCLVEVPAEFKTVTKTMNMGCDGSGIPNSGCTKTIETPAKIAVKNQMVIKKAASYNEEVIPAEYTNVLKTILKKVASTREEVIPAIFTNIQKQVLKKPASYKEEPIPAAYKTITKEVLVTPATVKEVVVPAEYKTVKRKVLKTPATVKSVEVPAQYDMVDKRVMVSPERINKVPVPAEYQTVMEKQLVKEASATFKRIICEKDITDKLIHKIQKALMAKGYNPGPIDDIFGPKSKAALKRFQEDNNLLSGHLDFETVEKLGLPTNPAPSKNQQYADNSGGDAIIAAIGVTKKDELTEKGGSKDNATEKTSQTEKPKVDDKKDIDKPKDDVDSKINGASAEEMDMIDEINLMRSNPAGYVKYIEEYIENLKKDEGWDDAYKQEEIATANELIAELKKTGPLSILKPHDGLYKVGTMHGNDLQSRGVIEHTSSDGSWPWDRVKRETDLADGNENLVGGANTVRESVIILLIDSGIPNRGHRKTMMEAKWNYVACKKVGQVSDMTNTWVQMFGQ